MKCVAIAMLSVGAYAVQDTEPPVISLTLATTGGNAANHATLTASETRGDHTDNAHHAHSCAVWTTGTTDSYCPDPVCSSHDHHDGEGGCDLVVTNINNDNDVETLLPAPASKTADKSVRSMWLYKYDKTDASGNQAETVTFELTMYDHLKPVFTIDDIFANDVSRESCNAGGHTPTGAPYFAAHADPCTWTILATNARAQDNYDGNVDARIASGMGSTAAQAKANAATPNANHAINTMTLGVHHFYWSVCDKAGQFGAAGANNCEEATRSTTIQDTTPPVLTLINAEAPVQDGNNYYECGTEGQTADGTACTSGRACGTDKSTYVEHSSTCMDLRDSWTNTAYDDARINVDITSDVDTATENDAYTVSYSCTDNGGDAHKQTKTRTVKVVDNTAPVITLTGDHVIENSAGAHVSTATGTMDTGTFDAATMKDAISCADACDKVADLTLKATLHYGACTTQHSTNGNLVGDGELTNFPEYTAGDYSVKYVCTDKSAHTDTTCRTIRNVDHTKPVIQILGSDSMTLEATHEGNYIDDGATCSDQVDGVISQNVEVSGDVVNLSKVGSYTITYNCKDSAGNAAPTLSRSVHVAQTSCPTCVITGAGTVLDTPLLHEASFPYTDEGATCTDIIDGTVATHVTNPVKVQNTGTYVVTYRAVNSVGLWNDGKAADGVAAGTGCRGTAINYFRTVKVSDTLKPVIKLTYATSTTETDTIAWGHNGPKSTNADTRDNPFNNGVHDGTAQATGPSTLMAEEQTSSVNGWVLGAIASAVTGLALLGYSQRKTTVATSVPV
jgi:hypothetical protein